MSGTDSYEGPRDLDDEGSYGDAVRSRVDRLYAIADAPGCPPEEARVLAGKAAALLRTIGIGCNF